ncbi:hypothetical protein, partial [Rodentibacter caecimuris]|uniref:hypothetical protein n=1 Tax=Rodentibacter caecimuris TaxID=1796644 RepID=UPI0019593BA3
YYSLNDIKKIINLFPEIKVSSVIDWSIPWGPTGGPKGIWDSDYGQHQSWEHALSRFLLDANCAIFGDIDEYPVSKNNRAIPDILSSIDEPVLSYKRRQIVEVNKENFINHGVRLPCDTGYYEPSKSEIAPKYAIKPKLINNGQLMAHTVLNTPCYNCSDIISRHMGNMRLDWRNDRFELIKLKSISDYSELEFDKELDSTFNQVNLDWLTKLDLRK